MVNPIERLHVSDRSLKKERDRAYFLATHINIRPGSCTSRVEVKVSTHTLRNLQKNNIPSTHLPIHPSTAFFDATP
ncbi:MAG: hypothetical protein QNJ46_36075 [Leptolyngbyaceae cyanobacterium MO_188.B28]|nr:hypothetical protein [Leptolyngbyaceae cyanobacterium MO_188.B28]